MIRARGLMGDEMKAMVKTVLTESTTQTNTLKRKQHVEYLDEADLKKRLVDKPDQVQRIIDSGAAMAKLNEARNQFKVIKKMLKAMQPNPIPAESQCD